jgi:hypothetical protein
MTNYGGINTLHWTMALQVATLAHTSTQVSFGLGIYVPHINADAFPAG